MQWPAVWLILGASPKVGTVTIAEGLITALRRAGAPAVGIKPIDLGCAHSDDHDLQSADGDRLWNASERSLPPLVVAPYRFPLSDAPVAAAQAAGLELTLVDVLATIEEATRFGGPVVVVGPANVDDPFVTDGDVWALARATSAQVILVADDDSIDRLGPLSTRAAQDQLTARRISHTSSSISDAIHVPASETDKDEVAAALQPLLET